MHARGRLSIPCRVAPPHRTILSKGVMAMGDDDMSPTALRTNSELFHQFGMTWDEYEVPFDPTAAIDGDG